MKILTIATWICGIGGALIIITGLTSLLCQQTFFGLRHAVNYFHVANSVLLLGILCLQAKKACLQNRNKES
jgi:hypothetical protein